MFKEKGTTQFESDRNSRWGAEYNMCSAQPKNSSWTNRLESLCVCLNVPAHIPIQRRIEVEGTPKRNTLITFVDSGVFLTSLFASSISHQPESPTTQADHTRWEYRSSLADMNADGLPHGFEVARSCVGKCLSAHRAMWQPQARILEPNGKRSSMASSSLFRRSTQWIHQICLEPVCFFPRNRPKDTMK